MDDTPHRQAIAHRAGREPRVFVAPAHWALYLLHRDDARIRARHGHAAPAELKRVQGWLESIRPYSIKDVAREADGTPGSPFHTGLHDCNGFANALDFDATFREYLAMPGKALKGDDGDEFT